MEVTERYYYSWHQIYNYQDNSWDTIYIESYPHSNCSATDVLLDSKGNFWVTTPDYCLTGVYKFDGIEWTDFNTREIFSSDIGNSLYGIVETSNGEIIISAGSRFLKYKNDQWSVLCNLESLAADRYLASLDLYADSKNNIWFPIIDYGTFDGLLYCFNGKEYRTFDLAPFPYSEEQEIRMVNCIIEDSRGIIWVGTTDGLFKIVK